MTGGCDRARDAGFTLIEVLIVLGLMPILVGGISVAIITIYQDQRGVSTRLSDSHDAQITSAYFVRDVQQGTSVSTATTPLCAPSGVVTAQLVGLSWQPSGAPKTSVTYAVTSVGSGSALVRYDCTGAAAAATTTVSHSVSTTTPTTVSVACFAGVACTPVNGVWPAGGVKSVAIAITEPGTDFSYRIVAAPRAAPSNTIPGGHIVPPLLLLGGSGASCDATGALICTSGSGTLTVHGPIEATSQSGCALDATGSGGVVATAIYTNDPTPAEVVCGSKANKVTGTASTPPDLTTVGDPFADLAPVAQPATAGSCSAPVNHVITCTPGYYATTLVLSSANDVVFQTGTYYLQQGIKITGSGSVSSAPGGVLFYIAGGTTTITASGATNLAPLATGNVAPSLLIYQARTDINQVTLTGSGAVSAFAGIVYAPSAPVKVTSAGGTTVASVIAQTATLTGAGDVTLG